MYKIEATNISKKFNNTIVLNNLNFCISKGEIVSIIGPSGQGKSTFLRCLSGLQKIDFGTIKINNQFLVHDGNYSCKKTQQKALEKIGVIFQNFNLFNNLTVLQNIEIPIKNKNNLSKELIREKSESLIKKFGLKNKENLYPKNLSGGQKQLTAIARTLILAPEIILFDEPTSALDPKMTDQISEIIKNLSLEGYTIIIVTHNIPFAQKTSNRILEIKNGYLINNE